MQKLDKSTVLQSPLGIIFRLLPLNKSTFYSFYKKILNKNKKTDLIFQGLKGTSRSAPGRDLFLKKAHAPQKIFPKEK